MPKPTTEELILKELRAIRGLLEGFASRPPPKEEKTNLLTSIKGLDQRRH